jgi:hypothetical protein
MEFFFTSCDIDTPIAVQTMLQVFSNEEMKGAKAVLEFFFPVEIDARNVEFL